MKSKRVNLPYKLFSQGNPSQATSKSFLVSGSLSKSVLSKEKNKTKGVKLYHESS